MFPKSRFCEIKLFPSNTKFHETFHVFSNDNPSTANAKRGFLVLTLLSTKLQNGFRGLDPVKHQKWTVLQK